MDEVRLEDKKLNQYTHEKNPYKLLKLSKAHRLYSGELKHLKKKYNFGVKKPAKVNVQKNKETMEKVLVKVYPEELRNFT